ncbi:hypothetical protein [Amycolatopsis pigmentata]|uniref:Uncharacterized protein n=1 Tax=Amycolatopsis pigmentata TaxID=450801 RepID=A0ABW5FQE1_9PSEU
MNDDVSQNLVVFKAKGFDEPLVAGAPIQADDAVEQAWAGIRRQHNKVRASAVSAVFSEWQPSAADQKFMAKHFRKAECTYSFARPADGDRERAFAKARAVSPQGPPGGAPSGVAARAVERVLTGRRVARRTAASADSIREQVLGSPHDTTELVPSVRRLGPGGLDLLAQRGV